MDKELKERFDKCFEMCDYIEANGVLKEKLNTSLRENLKKEFLNFMIYIALVDDKFGDKEQRFIKEQLGFEITYTLAAAIKSRNKLTENYGNEMPLTFKYFVLSNAGRKIKADIYDNKEAKYLAQTYRKLGQSYIAGNDEAGQEEIDA